MPARIIPSYNTQDRSVSRGGDKDVFAPIWTSQNIDLTGKPGVFRLTPRVSEILNNGDDADMELPVSFLRTNADGTDRWWALTQADGISRSDGLMFKSTSGSPVSAWAQDAIASTPTDACDNMVIFGFATTDTLIVARDTDLTKLNNGAWTASWWVTTLSQSALSASYFHHIHVFLNLLMVPDNNVIHTVDDSNVVVTNRLVLPDEYEIIWIEDDGRFAYIGTRHKRGGVGLIFIWDGTAETYNFYREGGGTQTFCGRSKKGIMYTMNDHGELLKFDGDQFSEIASLPYVEARRLWFRTVNSTSIGDRNLVVRQNGMDVIGDNIHVLLSGLLDDGSGSTVLPNFPGGIWEFDDEVGFYPKYLLSAWDGVTSSGEDDEWGQPTVRNPGALKSTNEEDSFKSLLAGGILFDSSLTEKRYLMSTSDPNLYGTQTSPQLGEHRGHFTTTKIQGYQDFKSYWTRLKASYRGLEDANAGILIKYRTSSSPTFGPEGQDVLYSSITWTGGNSFTINDADGAKLSVGDEIEFIAGEGSGGLAHILTIVNTSANNYTITMDETFTGMSGSGIARFSNFKRLGSTYDSTFASSSQTIQDKLFTIAKRSKWLQLKVELRVGNGGNLNSPELDELFVEFQPSSR